MTDPNGSYDLFKDASRAYHELEEEGKLKLRTYSYIMVEDNTNDAKGDCQF